jgi:hypothetical protein
MIKLGRPRQDKKLRVAISVSISAGSFLYLKKKASLLPVGKKRLGHVIDQLVNQSC